MCEYRGDFKGKTTAAYMMLYIKLLFITQGGTHGGFFSTR
jgi:hypothetical protein